ncbi:MAG: DUF6597 domain-containing transcriptional factor [Sandaracinaceae bacterium]
MEIQRGSSPRGAWLYASWRPASLAPFVDHLWGYAGPTIHSRKRIFPNGCVELIVNLGEPYAVPTESGEEPLPRAWLSGPFTGPLVVRQPAWQHCVAARLRPAGAFAVLGGPVREVTGLSVDLRDVLGLEIAPLQDRCAALGDVEAQLRALAAWLRLRTASARPIEAPIAWAIRELDASSGSCPIGRLRERTGLSKARFVAGFRDGAGLPPKLYGRIVRFRGVLSRLQEQGAGRIASVAVDSRFYDQPHLNAEFRSLAGMTPTQFILARHPVGDGSTAADLVA